MLTQERLKQILSYNSETGIFLWLIKPRVKVIHGNIAGSVNRTDGRTNITVDCKRYKAHRLAWFYMTGEWPTLIDHANGNASDNRWKNLRLATETLNHANAKRRSDNSSGFKCVSWDKRAKRWAAYINKDQKKKHIGYFVSPVEAHAAYVTAARALFGEFARGA